MAEALKYETIFFLIGIAAGLILILPFFNSLVFAAVFAFMIYPVHKVLTKYTSETMSAALLTFILMAIVTIFLVLGAKLILDELATIYFYVIGLDFNTLFAGREELAVSFEAISGFVFTQLINYSSSFVSRLPSLALSFVVFIFTLFFFIRDGAKTFAWFEKNLPIADVIKRGIFKDIQNYASAFINVWLVIGAVQALMATIGFYLFGLPYPIFRRSSNRNRNNYLRDYNRKRFGLHSKALSCRQMVKCSSSSNFTRCIRRNSLPRT